VGWVVGTAALVLLFLAVNAVSLTVIVMDLGTAKFKVGQLVTIYPSVSKGLVVDTDCWRRTCRYLVRMGDPVNELWLREAGLETARLEN